MFDKHTVKEQIEYSLTAERQWDDHKDKQDLGSYCEEPSPEGVTSCEIVKAWRVVTDLLLQYERKH